MYVQLFVDTNISFYSNNERPAQGHKVDNPCGRSHTTFGRSGISQTGKGKDTSEFGSNSNLPITAVTSKEEGFGG